VIVVNFCHEEIELPKATILDVAEEISPSLVAEINGVERRDSNTKVKARSEVNSVATDSVFKQYLKEKLGHLNAEERAVMKQVLRKYRHVFHREGSNDFKGTDLVKHEIITGDARSIRKAQYRVPFALRKEMEDQVQDMLAK
jgi:hypothetical protein